MQSIKHLTAADVHLQAYRLSRAITTHLFRDTRDHPVKVYGVPRGGVPVALSLLSHLPAGSTVVDDPRDAMVIVDDIIDSGTTRARYANSHPGTPFFALIEATGGSPWYVFPWEATVEGSTEDIVTRLLQFIGEDPAREGLRETPARVIKAWREWTSGYAQDPIGVLKSFADGAEGVDEMVIVRDIPFYSHCEHHLAPFFGSAHIAYIPRGKVVGLSKLARLVNIYARRLQVQERMTQQIAGALHEVLDPIGVGVIVQARHMCMESRGVQKAGATTVTSCMLGAMRDSMRARSEFLTLAQPPRS